MKRFATALCGIFLAACGPSEGERADTAPREPPRCSADTLQPDVSPPEGLPVPVSDMRRVILEAAANCEYERLEALALGGDIVFLHDADTLPPAAHWRELEGRGEAPLALLVRTLELPYARQSYDTDPRVAYLWPSAYKDGATGFDVFALKGLYSDAEIGRFIEQGSYTGSRVGILENGDWWFFVPGDLPGADPDEPPAP